MNAKLYQWLDQQYITNLWENFTMNNQNLAGKVWSLIVLETYLKEHG
jgi:hypothetical protein